MSQTTKRALEASFKKLLLEKPLNKITINDITEDCGVNRMTFYYHFKDIYDLVDWILAEDAAKAMEGRRGFGTWSEAYLDVLRQLQDNKTLVLNVYRSVGREQWEVVLNDQLPLALRRGMTAEQITSFSPCFVQIHQSYIINIDYLMLIRDNRCVLYPPFDKITELLVSKKFKKELQERFCL